MEHRNDGRSAPEAETPGIPSEQTAAATGDGHAPFKVFATKEDYQAYFDKVMGQRLKAARKNAEKLEKLTPILSALQKVYGVSDEEELFCLLEQEASAGGQAGTAGRKAPPRELLEKELAQAAKQDSAYAALDPGELASDSKFMALLSQGFGVKEAYDALHLNEMAQKLAKQTSKQIVDNIMARGSRPPENAWKAETPNAFVPNVAAMSNDEIDALLKRVKKGESISF